MDFSNGQLSRARYWYEKVAYTHYTPSLSTGTTSLFSVYNVVKAAGLPRLAILKDLASTQAASVSLAIDQTLGKKRLNTQALPSSLQAIMTGEEEGARATGPMSLSASNSSGSAVAPFQVNYAVAIKQPSVAEKMFLGLSLTQKDAALQQQFHLTESVQEGFRPLSIKESLRRVFYGSVISEDVYTGDFTSSDGTLFSLSPSAGQMLVITGIASNATAGNLVQLTLNRDVDAGYMEVLADNMSLDTPLSVWIPVEDNASLAISAQTATNSVPVRMTVLTVKKTEIMSVLFGETSLDQLQGSQLNNAQQVLAGVSV